MDKRDTQAVLQDHLNLARDGDIEADLDRNFDPDCMLLTTYGNFRGHAGAREAADLLDRQLGRADTNTSSRNVTRNSVFWNGPPTPNAPRFRTAPIRTGSGTARFA